MSSIYVCMTTGPVEMEEADLSALSPTLATPDVERRDVGIQEQRTKRDVPGMDYCYFSPTHLIPLVR